MKICVYGASSYKIDSSFIQAGEKLGEIMAHKGHSLIFGGGANGMMGAAARGVYKGKGEIIGISPELFNVDGVLFENCNQMILTKTMRERKKLLEEMSDGFVVTPGGNGTFDEFFEILTLKQLGYHNKPIAILNTNGYFDKLVELFEEARKGEFVKDNCLKLYKVLNTPEEVIDYIENYNDEGYKVEELKNIK
ncbi:MAG: TIGR00730 family Rossman fold protein [Ruminococcaceae bacterium]|nr:TIGR00730 family Rossman fold protein [Oscillospiraceae bacterium]